VDRPTAAQLAEIKVETEIIGPDRQHELEFNTREHAVYGKRIDDELTGNTVACVVADNGCVVVLRHGTLPPKAELQIPRLVERAKRVVFNQTEVDF
jgi:hypothetical protein